jgi:hypothetical protein
MAGLGYTADQFFIFLLFTYLTTMAMLIFFRCVNEPALRLRISH